ncbi:MAG: RNB domain-containing ribonuclease, partial [Candidatus Cloacimonetes bacterium]|nr:RNB domain-containing ribonuclease [Candidatus Cloacimonadota bacterium]
VTEFDADCNITSQKAFESIIRSSARLNYEEVDILFDGGKTNIPEDIAAILEQMRILSQALNRVRLARGYLQLNLPETEFIFDDEGHISDLSRSVETDSHALIENFMLIANEYVARQLGKQSTLYRIHEQPDLDRIEYVEEILQIYGVKYKKNSNMNLLVQNMLQALPDANYHRVFDHMILRSMKRARYSIQNAGHFGLALVDYTHFTSPIRRLCDLVIHHQLKNHLHGQESPFPGQVLFRYAGIATEKEQIADESEREVELKNKLIFMRKQLGADFTGIIVAVRPNSLVVELDRYPVTGIITLASMKDDYYEYLDPYQQLIGKKKGKIFKLTDRVKVIVSQVTDDIYFQIIY